MTTKHRDVIQEKILEYLTDGLHCYIKHGSHAFTGLATERSPEHQWTRVHIGAVLIEHNQL